MPTVDNGFDAPEQIVQDFLNQPAPGGNTGHVQVSLAYPQLVGLVRRAYRTGIADERTRRTFVTAFEPVAAEGNRFTNLELREKENVA